MKNNGFMGNTVQHNDSVAQDQYGQGEDSDAAVAQTGKNRAKPGMQDFEEIFGKDIDQFLEDSEWDVRSQDKVSGDPAVKNTKKLKQLEKQFNKAAN